MHDSGGTPQALAAAPWTLLASYLTEEIQGSFEHADLVLGWLGDVACGTLREHMSTGNAHELTIQSQEVRIVSDYLDLPPCLLSHEEFRRAVQSWRTFILSS